MITSAIIYFRTFESRDKHYYGDDSSFALCKTYLRGLYSFCVDSLCCKHYLRAEKFNVAIHFMIYHVTKATWSM